VGTDCDVEHFRPKSSVCQGRGKKREVPGYYWLAYEWSNLLLACTSCNQRYKRDYFPLADRARRVRDPDGDIGSEEPLLIDPAEQDPEAHISFREEIPYPIDGSRLGRTTIELLRLHAREEDLNERRRTKLALLRKMREIVLLAEEDPDDQKLNQLAAGARRLLDQAVEDGAEFAAMARAAARENFYLAA
jgi:hypothetical protein